jgi:hypothetical protein
MLYVFQLNFKSVRAHNYEFIHLFYNEAFDGVYDNYQEFFSDDMCDVPKCVGQLTTCGEYISAYKVGSPYYKLSYDARYI